MATPFTFPPAPPMPAVNPAEPNFTDPTWQRWLAQVSSGLQLLQQRVADLEAKQAAHGW